MTVISRTGWTLTRLAALVVLTAVGGCASEHYRRGDGVTDGLGDSVAHNSALQIADPWQEGVENTDIDTPYVRPKTGQDGESDTAETTADTPPAQ